MVMSATRNLDKPVKGGPAKALAIDPSDLPQLHRPWTKRDVVELRNARPEWLTAARRRHAAARDAAATAKTESLAQRLRDLGYGDADAGTLDFYFGRVDGAMTHLQCTTKCTDGDADNAARVLWPKTMAVADDYEDDEPSDEWSW